MEVGVTTLSEFRYIVSKDEELEGLFITPIQDKLENKRLQLARLRHCWNATCAAEAQRVSAGDTAPLQLDEEELLPSAQLTSIRELFWARYKLVFPPEFTPSDRLLTKAKRALTKRSLEVVDLWQVRSIANQRMATTKRRRLAPGLYYGGDPDEVDSEVAMNWHSYLVQLRLYLLALAMAGAKKLEPQPSDAETATTDSCAYVEVPFDVITKYLCRAESWAMRTTEQYRLSLLASLDRAERAEWAHRLAELG